MSNALAALNLRAPDPTVMGLGMAAVRRQTPVYYDESKRCWVMMRYRDIHAALRNPEVFSNGVYQHGPMGGTFVAADGDDHARHRRVYSRIFHPAAIKRFEEEVIADSARRVLDRLDGKKDVDLVRDFALPFPIEVIGRLLSLTPDDMEAVRDWVRDMLVWVLFFYDPEIVARGRRSQALAMDRLRPKVERQLRQPDDGLIGSIIKELRGEGLLIEEQVVQLAVGMLLAGYETTNWTIAGALGALLQSPDSMRRVRQDRSLLMPAVEESMRWGNGFLGAMRYTLRDVEVSGVRIPKGDAVLLCTASAHYDDEVFPRPEVFDIERRPDHLLFLVGPHYCLGAPLARMEARVGIGMLLDRLPGLRLDPAAPPPTWVLGVHGSVLHGPEALPVVYDAEQLALAA